MANYPSTAPLGYSLLRSVLGRVACRTTRGLDRYFDWRVVCPTLPIAPVHFHRTGESKVRAGVRNDPFRVFRKRSFSEHRATGAGAKRW
jgi:hypothetical protein